MPTGHHWAIDSACQRVGFECWRVDVKGNGDKADQGDLDLHGRQLVTTRSRSPQSNLNICDLNGIKRKADHNINYCKLRRPKPFEFHVGEHIAN